MDTTYNNLPQIKSIWIDEDEETEKLYGLQAQQIMDSDGEEFLGVVTLNSGRPVLENRKNIELPPLPPSAYEVHKSRNPANIPKKRRKWTRLLRSLSSRDEQPSPETFKISVPFAFQHISHANGKSMFTSAGEEGSNGRCSDFAEGHDRMATQQQFSSAFVTDALPTTASSSTGAVGDDTGSQWMNRSISSLSGRSSARASRISSGMMSNRGMSTSTMATSLLAEIPPLRHSDKAPAQKKQGWRSHSHASIEGLRNYRFPVVPEESLAADIPLGALGPSSGIENDTVGLPQQLLSPPTHPANTPRRRNSESLVTPVLCMRSEFEDMETPRGRKSLDDVLHYYHQASEAESTCTRGSSRRFSFVRGSPMAFYEGERDRDSYLL